MSLARSGGVFYGGLILAVIVAFWYIGRHRLPFWTTCDIFAPGIALGHVTGRLGCLAAGCCYGSPTDVPWAITFTNPPGRRERRYTHRHRAASNPNLRGRRRTSDSRTSARHRAPGPTICGADILGVHVSVRGVTLHRRDLSRRSTRHAPRRLDFAIHLARAGTAEPRDAGLAVQDGTHNRSSGNKAPTHEERVTCGTARVHRPS